jgi:cytoskeletal protein CcmA (bactofilin family)
LFGQGKVVLMAWFDRGSGEKKDSEVDPTKTSAVTVKPESIKSSPPPFEGAKGGISEPGSNPPPAQAVASQSNARPPSADADLVGRLYKGSRVSGQLTFQGSARIDGKVEGEIQCHGTLTIGDGADVRARISSQAVIIRGKVEGNVTAREKVELIAPGRVIGNISAPRLTVTEGVVFEGDCSMGVAKQKSGVASSQAISTDKAAPAQQSDSHK